MSISKTIPQQIAASAQSAPCADRCAMIAKTPLEAGQPTTLRSIIAIPWDPIQGRSTAMPTVTPVLGPLRSIQIPIAPQPC